MPSSRLSNARRAKKNEFYTLLVDIEKELKYYKGHFSGKIVYCNCDDPYESNFFKYFIRNFNVLGLKKLITTCYAGSPVAGTKLNLDFSGVARGVAHKIEITAVNERDGLSIDDIEEFLKSNSTKKKIKRLEGDGDFRSEECVKLLKEADIVVTNPPFSLFRDYVAQLMEHEKKFLIIGNVQAITYNEIFPLIKANKMWLGPSITSGDRKFYVPDDYELNASNCGVEDGRKYIRVKGVRWFTNLDHERRHEELVLYETYSSEQYPKYDNYDAIDVGFTKKIPKDYGGEMGVPITFLDKYNPDQFEIVGLGNGREHFTPNKDYINAIIHNLDGKTKKGDEINRVLAIETATPPTWREKPYYTSDNSLFLYAPFARILIRKKQRP